MRLLHLAYALPLTLAFACDDGSKGSDDGEEAGSGAEASDLGESDAADAAEATETAAEAEDGSGSSGEGSADAEGSSSDEGASATDQGGTGAGSCGNDIIEPGADEQCEGEDLNSETCESQGFPGGGFLACDPITCTYDFSLCMQGGTGGTDGM